MKHRTRRNLKDIAGLAALISTFSAVLIFMPVWFAKLDCNTATRHLTYMEDCRADNNCTLTHAENMRYKAYLRMKVATCPLD